MRSYGATMNYDDQRKRIFSGVIFSTTALISVTLLCTIVAIAFHGSPSWQIVVVYFTHVVLSAHYSVIKISYIFWILILGDRFEQLTILME